MRSSYAPGGPFIPIVAAAIPVHLLFQNEQALGSGSQALLIPAVVFKQSGVYGWQVQAGSVLASGKVLKM